MIFVFYTLHVLVSLFLVLVVLLQQGKGADLSVFGGGGTMTAFGARGAATLLHKLTVVGFVFFIMTTVVIGVLESSESQSSVMGGIVPAAEAAAPAEAAPADAPAAAEAGAAEGVEDSGSATPEGAATGEGSAAGEAAAAEADDRSP